MTRAEALKIREAIECGAQSLPDAMALKVPRLFLKWRVGALCAAGVRVQHEGVLYCCLQEHTTQEGWEPNNAPSLFAKVLIEDPNVISAWEQPSSTNPYALGDVVAHSGKVWESEYDNNVWEPGVFGWKEVTQ